MISKTKTNAERRASRVTFDHQILTNIGGLEVPRRVRFRTRPTSLLRPTCRWTTLTLNLVLTGRCHVLWAYVAAWRSLSSLHPKRARFWSANKYVYLYFVGKRELLRRSDSPISLEWSCREILPRSPADRVLGRLWPREPATRQYSSWIYQKSRGSPSTLLLPLPSTGPCE